MRFREGFLCVSFLSVLLFLPFFLVLLSGKKGGKTDGNSHGLAGLYGIPHSVSSVLAKKKKNLNSLGMRFHHSFDSSKSEEDERFSH
jgi:hypothetical protein